MEGVKEKSPMFPRLHVKDAEKVGPKGLPRNKMALYEKLIFPSSGSPPKFPPMLRTNFPVPSFPDHVGRHEGMQFCNSGVSCYMAEKLHAYQSTTVNFSKLMPDGFISSDNSVELYEHDYALVSPVSANGKNSCCSISQNEEDGEKLVHCKSRCSLTSQSSFSERVNLTRPIKLKPVRYERNQKDGHIEVNHTDLPEEGSAHPLADFGDMKDESLIKIRTSKLWRTKGGNGLTKGENASFVDKLNLREGSLEKAATSGVLKCPGIGRTFFYGKGYGHKVEDAYRHCDAPSKNVRDSEEGMKITHEDVRRIGGEEQFWKARTDIIKQQGLFAQQVFELHRLIKVQKLIAGSTKLFIRDRLLSRRPSLKVSAPKKLQPDYAIEPPSSNVKLNNIKFEKPTPVECAENNSLQLPGVNNMSKVPSEQLPNYGHHTESNQLVLAAPTNNTKPSPCYIYPASGNQWLVPFMSPSEGLVYKPIGGTCPPNTGFMEPVPGACNPISLTPGKKGVQDVTHVPYIFPTCGPPVMLHSPTISAFCPEQVNPPTTMQYKGTNESYQSAVVVNSAMLYQSSSNMSSQISQVMSTHVTSDNQTSEDKDIQISTGSSTPKRMKGDALPLFPTVPTFWASSDQQKAQAIEENQPRIIKAIPHNPNSTTESAARIFRSIKEERKYL